MSERDHEIEAAVSVMRTTLEAIADRNDCDYADAPARERPMPCPCSKCRAMAALRVARNWRFMGARHDRVASMPRERRIMDAFQGQMNDRLLAQILCDEPDRAAGIMREMLDPPTPRDWYVAASVVQWLATNVGMEVLRKAGFEYKGYEQDRVEIERRRAGKDEVSMDIAKQEPQC